jgi:ribonuclease P protein component
MFKKTERLTQSEFAEFFKVGKRHHFPGFTIITAPGSKRKVSVVVGKKVLKSAVKRNLLRRRVYATLRLVLGAIPYQGVLIVLLKSPYVTLGRKQAAAQLSEVIAQVLKSA